MNGGLEEHLDALVGKLDLPRKVRLLTGASHWRTYAEPAVGLREITVSDGPAGVRGPAWDNGSPSACLPCPTGIAASWDVDRAAAAGRVLAAEATRKDVDVVLAPTANLQRSPLAGRHFEWWSEDPVLTGRLAAALVGTLQRHGVAATVKHYVANDSETERATVDIRLDERTLREVYLAPFEHIVRNAQPWLVMASYNAVNGTPMTEHDLLDSPLRTRWGFDGLVMSDWYATRSVAAAASAGLDLIMPGPGGPWGPALVQAVTDGLVSEAAVDAKVKNLLRLAARLGALESVPVSRTPVTVDARRELRAAAVDGTVLLRNSGDLLPLAPERLRRVAVFGELAGSPRIQGGGSAEVRPTQVVSPLDGLEAALPPGVQLTYTAGSYLEGDPATVPPGMLGSPVLIRWLDDTGAEVAREDRRNAALVRLGADVPAGATTVELTTRIVPDVSGTWQLGLSGAGRIVFAVDGRTLLDDDVRPTHEGPGAEILTPPVRTFDVPLDAGRPVDVLLRQRMPRSGCAVSIRSRPPRRTPAEELAVARERARAADVAIVVVGTSSQTESEGFDRADLSLPDGQDDLVQAVAAENPNTVVVVNAGAPVLLPWRDDVAAVLVTWFGGQESGAALADVLLGHAEPGGRLPMTWPAHGEDVPVLDTAPAGGRLAYGEGLHVGYRAWLRAGVEPAYPFGHGVGYTSWEVVSVDSGVDGDGGPDATVRVSVRNTGPRPGKQVLQVYLARPGSGVDRPARWLAGFAVVRGEPGETRTAEIPLPPQALRHWDAARHDWAVEPGTFEVAIGFSCADIRGTTSIKVHEE
ncbi:glycoside hydrolase family 3 C-terminal domain-containing protein [Nonomuraea sp. NPDC005650]|uniref:beta-glucosidase family protein n=1 Tax=Nonomuraea sp. NPDC005650 TaxID=3157045 RepID=UPI0033AF0241